jgi:two-component system alkaline phosphatase synthesis response regulator PhoP
MSRVLIVEDDEAMGIALRDGFDFEGYEVQLTRDGETALELALRERWDLILLDVMLPKMSGLEVCKRIRRDQRAIPIIMLTAKGQEIDKVLGLKTGADDYVTKPFSFLELIARVEAVLRRSAGRAEGPASFDFGDVRLNFSAMEATKAGTEIDLSRREFELLRFMIDQRGKVLSRERILDAVWGYDHESHTRTVDMHVAKLRKKIEDHPEDPQFILTVHRVGYKFNG